MQRKSVDKTFVVSLENRKARGSGHERCDEILAAARALFLEKGVESVSTRQIAGRVGISQTAFYNYFENKDHLLDRIMTAAFAKLGAVLEAVTTDDPVLAVREAAVAYIGFGLAHPDEYRLAFMLRDGRRATSAEGLPLRTALGDTCFSRLERKIERGLAAGVFAHRPGADANTIARSVWASWHGLVAVLLAFPGFGHQPSEILVDTHIDAVMKGLAARP